MKRIRSILAATDFSVDGRNAAHRAAQLAQQLGARLSLLHVVQPAGIVPLSSLFSANLQERTLQARTALRRLADDIGARYELQAGYEVTVGDTFSELLQGAAGQDLVVVGHRGQSRFKRLVMGGIASRFLRCCPCDVLAVKQPANGPYQRVLVPFDFAPCSRSAVLTAAQLAHEARLQVFHALGKPTGAGARQAGGSDGAGEAQTPDESAVTQRIRGELGELGVEGPQVEVALGSGAAVASTLRQAGALQADLIVAGKQGTHTVARFLLGTVSRHLIVGSNCDIAIVSPPLERPARVQVAGRSQGALPARARHPTGGRGVP